MERILGTIILVSGVIYAIVFLKTILAKEDDGSRAFEKDQGKLPVLMCLEGAVFFLCTLGISDFLNKKLVLCGMTAGVAMAIVGVLLAISLDQLVLNIILLIVMAIAILSLKPQELIKK